MTTASDVKLKIAVKEAILELVEERRDLLSELLGEALEDLALGRAIEAGEQTPLVSRQQVLKALKAES